MSLNYKIIGSRLKQARIRENLTQEKLAERLDVSVTFLSRIERGSSFISLKRLNQICEVLGVTEGEILNDASTNCPSYLSQDFNNLLKNCPSDKINLIYDIAKIIISN